MTYEEIVYKVQKQVIKSKTKADQHIAVQFNIVGEGEGAFYIEIDDGRISVQPYEYYDRDAILTLSAASLLEIAAGKKDLLEAYHANEVSVWGDLDKVVEMKKVILPKTKEEKPVEVEKIAEKATEEKNVAEKPQKKEEECVQLEMHFEEQAETKTEEKVEEKKEEKVGGRRKRAVRKAAMRKASRNKK